MFPLYVVQSRKSASVIRKSDAKLFFFYQHCILNLTTIYTGNVSKKKTKCKTPNKQTQYSDSEMIVCFEILGALKLVDAAFNIGLHCVTLLLHYICWCQGQ